MNFLLVTFIFLGLFGMLMGMVKGCSRSTDDYEFIGRNGRN